MKIGILGGSFNPVHTGHVRMALESLERLGLSRVDFVPAARPPHKTQRDMLPYALRLRLAELAVEGISGLRVNPLEGRRPGPSYTCETLEQYRRHEPQAALFFILGTGTVLDLPVWHRSAELFSLASFVAVSRFDVNLEAVDAMVRTHWKEAQRISDRSWRFASGNTLECLDVPRLDIKASHIRQCWRTGRSLDLLVPPAVLEALRQGGPEYDAAWGPKSGPGDGAPHSSLLSVE